MRTKFVYGEWSKGNTSVTVELGETARCVLGLSSWKECVAYLVGYDGEDGEVNEVIVGRVSAETKVFEFVADGFSELSIKGEGDFAYRVSLSGASPHEALDTRPVSIGEPPRPDPISGAIRRAVEARLAELGILDPSQVEQVGDVIEDELLEFEDDLPDEIGDRGSEFMEADEDMEPDPEPEPAPDPVEPVDPPTEDPDGAQDTP